MKEILRNLARRKLRSTLTISGIVIGIFALTTMGAVANHFSALIDGGVVYFGSSIQIGDDSQGAGGNSFLPLSKVNEIQRVDGVAAAFASVGVQAKPGTVNAVSFGVPDFINSSDPGENQYGAFKLHMAQGRDLQNNGEVVLGTSFANEFKKKVGDSLDLPIRPGDARPNFVNHPFTVVGLLAKTETAPDTGAYVTLADAQMMLKDQLPPAIRDQINLAGASTNLELFLVTPGLALLAFGFAVALGALAGIAPAFRAARLDPVTALRMQS